MKQPYRAEPVLVGARLKFGINVVTLDANVGALFFRGLNPFLKDQLAERELLSRFNSLIASEQDRQRMAAMSAAYPPGNTKHLF